MAEGSGALASDSGPEPLPNIAAAPTVQQLFAAVQQAGTEIEELRQGQLGQDQVGLRTIPQRIGTAALEVASARLETAQGAAAAGQ